MKKHLEIIREGSKEALVSTIHNYSNDLPGAVVQHETPKAYNRPPKYLPSLGNITVSSPNNAYINNNYIDDDTEFHCADVINIIPATPVFKIDSWNLPTVQQSTIEQIAVVENSSRGQPVGSRLSLNSEYYTCRSRVGDQEHTISEGIRKQSIEKFELNKASPSLSPEKQKCGDLQSEKDENTSQPNTEQHLTATQLILPANSSNSRWLSAYEALSESIHQSANQSSVMAIPKLSGLSSEQWFCDSSPNTTEANTSRISLGRRLGKYPIALNFIKRARARKAFRKSVSAAVRQLNIVEEWKRKSKRQDDGAEMASAVLEEYLRKASIRQPTTRRLSMIRSSQKNEVEVSVSLKRKSKRQDDGAEMASAVLEEYLRKASIRQPTTRRLSMIRSSQKNEVEVSVAWKRKSKRQDDGAEMASAVLEEYLRKASIRQPTTRRLSMIRSSQKNEVEVSVAWKRKSKRHDDGTEMTSAVLEEYLRNAAIRQPTTRRLSMIRSSQKNEVEVSVAWKRKSKRQDDGAEMASAVLEEYLRNAAIRQPTTRRLPMIRSSQKNEVEVSVAWKRKSKRQDDGAEMASAVLEEYLRKAAIRQPTTRRLSMIRSSQKNEVEVSVAWKRKSKRQDDGAEMASAVLEEYLRKAAIRQPTTRRLSMIRSSQKNEVEVSVAWKRKSKRQDDGAEMASAVLEEYLRKAAIRQPATRRLPMIRSSQKNEVEVSVAWKRKSKIQDDGAEMASAVLEEYLRKAAIRQPTTRRLSMIRSSQKNEVEVSVAWKRKSKRHDDGTEMASAVLEEYLRNAAIRQPATRRLPMIISSQKNEVEVSVAWKRKSKRQDDGAEMASAVLEEYLSKTAIRQPTTRRLSMIRSSQKNEVEVSVAWKRKSKRQDDGAEMASAVLEEYLRKSAIRQLTTRRLSMIRSSQKNEVEVSVPWKRKSKRQD